MQAKINALRNPRLADVCLATSAAPTFLPPHFFETKDDVTNATRTYDVIDGAIAVNNPVSSQTYPVNKESTHKFIRFVDSILAMSTKKGNSI